MRVLDTVGGAWLLLAALPGAVRGQGAPLPLTPELQVNQVTASAQESPDVAMRPDGTHVIVWTSDGQDGAGTGIVQRRFPGDGSAPFNESVLNQVTAGDQLGAQIGMNSSGDWLIVWESIAGQGIRGRASSASGTSIGNEFQISEATSAGIERPTAGRADDGSFVAGWDAAGAFFRLFENAATPLTGDTEIEPTLAGNAFPAVASFPAGGFVAAFTANDADVNGIYLQRFDAAGLPEEEAIPAAEAETNNQILPGISVADDGSFVVVWTDSALGFRMRCFTATGEPRSGEISLRTTSVGGASVAVAPHGAIVAAFRHGEIEAFEFDRTCRPVGGPFIINTTTSGLQASPEVGVGNDRFVVAWHAANLDADGLAVARRLYRLRSIFADDFASEDFTAWSTAVQ